MVGNVEVISRSLSGLKSILLRGFEGIVFKREELGILKGDFVGCEGLRLRLAIRKPVGFRRFMLKLRMSGVLEEYLMVS